MDFVPATQWNIVCNKEMSPAVEAYMTARSYNGAYQFSSSTGVWGLEFMSAESPTSCHATAVIPLSGKGLPSQPQTPSTVTSSSSSGIGVDKQFGPPSSKPQPEQESPRNGKGAQYTIIANVPYETVRQDLVTEFRKFGRVELAMVVCDEASRHPHKEWTSTLGYAFVRFSKRSEAAAAIQAAALGLISIRGTRVRADWARKDSYAKRSRAGGNFGPSQSMSAPLPAATEGERQGGGTEHTTHDILIASGQPVSQRIKIMASPLLIAAESAPGSQQQGASSQQSCAHTSQACNVSLDLAAGLSPISRSVLTGALCDVGARSLVTDHSPPAPRRLSPSPEELLHLAVCTAPVQWEADAVPLPKLTAVPSLTVGNKGALARGIESDFSTGSDGQDVANSDGSFSTAARLGGEGTTGN